MDRGGLDFDLMARELPMFDPNPGSGHGHAPGEPISNFQPWDNHDDIQIHRTLAAQADPPIAALLQDLKQHPLFRPYLEGGELVEWGAKTIPEGGYYALPHRRAGDGVVILGDSAGFVDVPSLKGIHYAMHSGMLAARAILRAVCQPR